MTRVFWQMIWLNTGLAWSHSSSTRQVYTGTSARQRGELGMREPWQLFPLPASLWENTTEGSDNCLAYERAATFTSAHHISFSLLSGTILRRLKGESFDVEKMKIDCVVRLGLITSNSVAKVFICLFTVHSSCLECKSNWFNPIYLLSSPTWTAFWLKMWKSWKCWEFSGILIIIRS